MNEILSYLQENCWHYAKNKIIENIINNYYFSPNSSLILVANSTLNLLLQRLPNWLWLAAFQQFSTSTKIQPNLSRLPTNPHMILKRIHIGCIYPTAYVPQGWDQAYRSSKHPPYDPQKDPHWLHLSDCLRTPRLGSSLPQFILIRIKIYSICTHDFPFPATLKPQG